MMKRSQRRDGGIATSDRLVNLILFSKHFRFQTSYANLVCLLNNSSHCWHLQWPIQEESEEACIVSCVLPDAQPSYFLLIQNPEKQNTNSIMINLWFHLVILLMTEIIQLDIRLSRQIFPCERKSNLYVLPAPS
jgi:hypothetical protein